jgi:hypothetical protein
MYNSPSILVLEVFTKRRKREVVGKKKVNFSVLGF